MTYQMWTEHKTAEELREFDAALLGEEYVPSPEAVAAAAPPEPKSQGTEALMAAMLMPIK